MGTGGLGHTHIPGVNRTRIRTPFHRVIFTGFLYWGIAWIRQRSALQTLLNTAINSPT